MKIIEEWKPIKGYEGLYQISTLGRVKSLPRVRKCYADREYITKEKFLIYILPALKMQFPR